MLRLLADENFHGEILRGLLRREPTLDILRVQDAGLLGADDPAILEWAAREGRILLTHDRATVPDFAQERVGSCLPKPGVFLVGDRLPIGQVIDDLLLLTLCSEVGEWEGKILYLPL